MADDYIYTDSMLKCTYLDKYTHNTECRNFGGMTVAEHQHGGSNVPRHV